MAVMEGSLSKWTNVMKGWQYRWFVLDDNAGLLSYYTSKEKMMRGVRRGCVRLRGAIIGIDDEDDSTFTITVDHKTFHFQARNCDERERWVHSLEETITRHGRRVIGIGGTSGTDRAAAVAAISIRPPRLERKVAEADAYFQIMIDQVRRLDERVNEIADEEQRLRCRAIHEQANAMLENIMHSIALLQIAKNTVHPVNGIYTGPSNSLSATVSISAIDSAVITAPSTPGIELGAECTERRHSNLQRALTGTSMVLSVPETSYSSSEEDDDFFDADDQEFKSCTTDSETPSSTNIHAGQFPMGVSSISATAATATGPKASSKIPSGQPVSFQSQSAPEDLDSMGAPSLDLLQQIDQHPALPRTNDGKIDYDALYDDESDNEMDDMESHGSVVTHILSQVKIGMDLTKVVLPTFILERRSLLEMYADYFAHPDQFLKIADMQTPHERMVQVVRWYLSSYHAGRKSAVAKKPYNPVLGEVFRCYWDPIDDGLLPEPEKHLDLDKDSSPIDRTAEQQEGPVPWCNKSHLVFLAEQVSHHPPISAFYAEHVEKRIQFDAWVWTKSKFLGLSIGVQNIGKGIVTLLDHDEEYVLTFPNGYGRSILTVPWIELGGPVSVECPQTGHRAQIEFLTKPFYGGKKHRVTCEIYSPDDKKPYYTATGEWNARMEARWTENGRSEVLFDISSMRVHTKKVLSVLKQTERESRRVWRHVTAALKARDVDAATRAKQYVEQKQRDAVRVREEQSIVWQTQYFSEHGIEDGWMYGNPLKSRLHHQRKNRSNVSVASDKQVAAPHILTQR